MPRAPASVPVPTGPAWPEIRGRPIDDDRGLQRVVDSLRQLAPKAIGLWIGPDPTAGRHAADDWRSGSPGLLGLAAMRSEPDTFDSWVLDPKRDLDARILLSWLAEDTAPYVVTHGAQITVHRLKDWAGDSGAPMPARVGCTQIAAVLLAEGARRRPTALGECVSRGLDRPWPFEEPSLPLAGPDQSLVATTSAAVLVPLMRALTPMLRRRDLARVYDLECHLVPAVVDMERAGIGVDAEAFQRIADSWAAEQPTATDPDRQARLAKLLSTYARWPRDYMNEGRIHCRLHPLTTDSGRFSCTEPNLQQVPGPHVAPGVRACFGAAPGMALIIADYSQIELRVAAHLAPCDAMRAVFREGRDPHRATAATLAGKPEPEVTSRERQLAKAVNFGFLFGMGAPRFRSYAHSSYGLELDMNEARRAREAFLRTFPGIARWHDKVGRLGRDSSKSVTVRTVLGRRKRFEAGKVSFNAALNIPVQGTAAEGFKLAMTRLPPRLADIGGRGVLCVHDEYLAEVPLAAAEDGRRIVEETMREAMQEIVTSVPIEVEAHIARTWADK
ncbi:MAG: DNA polymerase [Myxococcota bacterium]